MYNTIPELINYLDYLKNGHQIFNSYFELCIIYSLLEDQDLVLEGLGTVGLRLSEPLIIQAVRLTFLLEYFYSNCMFY